MGKFRFIAIKLGLFMTVKKQKIGILGAGPCGLYAGRCLAQQGYDVVLIDKGERPGGLATSMSYGDNWYDLGVHMFHMHDKELFEDIKHIMGEERIEVDLDARIKWAGSSYRYPLQFQDMIKGIPFFKLMRQVFGLFGSQLYYGMFPSPPLNAEQALIQLYGKPLYKFFFEDFTHRYWGIHPTEISASFVASKMPKLTAVDVLKRGLSKLGIKTKAKSTESALAYETLSYSRTGAESMTRCIAEAIKADNGEIISDANVKQINNDGNKITSVLYEKDGTEHELVCDAFISTIPVNELIKRSEPQPPKEVVNYASRLRFKPIVVVGLLVNKPKCLECLYVYHRDQIFHRLGEPKNGGLEVTPSDHTVLIVEMTCDEGDAKWKMDDSVKEKIFQGLEEQNVCQREDIVEMHVSRYTEGYPIYALGFEPAIDSVKDYVKSMGNIITTGRQGGFTYPNMHSAMRMGADAADEVAKIFM